MGKNIRQRDLILAQIEFSNNCSTSQTTECSRLEIVYGKNLFLSLLYLVPFQTTQQFSGDVEE